MTPETNSQNFPTASSPSPGAPGSNQSSNRAAGISLKFVLSDSRIHSGLISMRWPEEVDRNVNLIANWVPPIDFATLPRLTFEVYNAEDAE